MSPLNPIESHQFDAHLQDPSPFSHNRTIILFLLGRRRCSRLAALHGRLRFRRRLLIRRRRHRFCNILRRGHGNRSRCRSRFGKSRVCVQFKDGCVVEGFALEDARGFFPGGRLLRSGGIGSHRNHLFEWDRFGEGGEGEEMGD